MRGFLCSVIAAALAWLAMPVLAGAAEDGPAAVGQVVREPDPSWQMSSTLSGRTYSLQYTAPNPATDGTSFGVDLALLKFGTPLRDDGAPYSLQPFLQRTSEWSLTLDGGHFSTHNPFGGEDRTQWSGGIAGSLDAYVRPWLALTGGLGYEHFALHDVGLDQSIHSFVGFVGLGLRVANTRFDVSYQLNAQDVAGSFAPLQKELTLSAFTAIAARFAVRLSGAVIPRGTSGDLSLEYFPTRDLGIFADAFAAKGKLYSEDLVFRRYGGSAGVAGWIDHTIEIVGEYTLTIENLPEQTVDQSAFGYHELSHAIRLTTSVRFDSL